MINGISIIVCCYNSAGRLPETLRHLFEQRLGSVECEIILVDNASTDGTASIAHGLAARHNRQGLSFQVVEAPTPGLSRARWKGIELARYEAVLFCDDDNWLAEDYIALAGEILRENPAIGVLGGRSEPVGEVDLPFWFYSYLPRYACGVQDLHSGEATERGILWGAGIVMRKALLLRVRDLGFSSLLPDRIGDSLSTGGDSEMCQWFLMAGYKLWYDERLALRHFLPAHRLTKQYLEANMEANRRDSRVIFQYAAVLGAMRRRTWQRATRAGLALPLVVMYRLSGNKFQVDRFRREFEANSPLPFALFDRQLYRIRKLSRQLMAIPREELRVGSEQPDPAMA